MNRLGSRWSSERQRIKRIIGFAQMYSGLHSVYPSSEPGVARRSMPSEWGCEPISVSCGQAAAKGPPASSLGSKGLCSGGEHPPNSTNSPLQAFQMQMLLIVLNDTPYFCLNIYQLSSRYFVFLCPCPEHWANGSSETCEGAQRPPGLA